MSPVVPSFDCLQAAVNTRPLIEVANRGAVADATISFPLLMCVKIRLQSPLKVSVSASARFPNSRQINRG